MLAQHHRAFPQRQALSTVLHDSGIKRRMGNGTAGGCGDDHAQVISPVTVSEFNLECSYKIDVMQVRIGEFSKSPVYTVVKFILRTLEGAQVVSQFLDEPKCVELTILLRLIGHENKMRTLGGKVKRRNAIPRAGSR